MKETGETNDQPKEEPTVTPHDPIGELPKREPKEDPEIEREAKHWQDGTTERPEPDKPQKPKDSDKLPPHHNFGGWGSPGNAF